MTPAIEISDAVEKLIDAIRVQTDLMTTVSSGGIALVLLTFARVLRMQSDVDLSNFRRPSILVIPLALFTVAVGFGYMITGSITGYFADIFKQMDGDVSKRMDGDTPTAITDASQHFDTAYFDQIYNMAQGQLISTVLAIVVVVSWYGINVLIRK